MQIGASSLLTEMTQLKASLSKNNDILPAIPVDLKPQSEANFGQLLAQAVGKVTELQSASSSLSTRLEMGDEQVSLSDTVIAREKASVAFEATIQVRNKLIEAYKDVMSMPI